MSTAKAGRREGGRGAGRKTGAPALLGPELPGLRRAAWLSVAGGLLWLPMAGLAAFAIAGLVGGQGLSQGAVLGFAGLAALRAVLIYLGEGRAQALALRALGRLRGEVLMRESLRAHPRSAGEAASVLAEQMEMLRPFAARYLTARLRVVVQPLAILAASFWISWAAGLILLVAGPAIPLFMALIGQATERASRAQLDRMGSISGELAERIAALPDIRLLGTREALVAGFAASADDLRRRTMRVLGIAFLSSTVLELFAAIGVAMMAIFCGFSLLGQIGFGVWGAPLAPWQGLFLLLVAPEFFQPLRDLAAVWHDRAAADAVADVLAPSGDRAAMSGMGGPALPVAGGLRLRGVCRNGIAYPDLDLAAGESLAVIGPSGAGKTTLLRLIAGLEAPDAGVIEVGVTQAGGQVLDGASADGWRSGIGWMPQAVHFLDATLAENIALGRSGGIAPALRMAAAEAFVAQLPQGTAQHLGETGSGVSGGEARRLTLARALHGTPRLILADEPTADLDAETAARVGEGLMAAHRAGAGLIVATHDPRLAARMSRRLVLGEGDSGDGENGGGGGDSNGGSAA